MRTLSRFVAATTLLLVFAMTTANYWCALCHLEPAKSSAASHCHEAAASTGLRVAAGHDCREHSSPGIIAAARTEPTIVLIAEAPRTIAAVIPVSLSSARRVARRASPPPLDLQSIPLRI